MINKIQLENASAVQTDDTTITITGPVYSGAEWHSDKEVVTDLSYNSQTHELTVIKETLVLKDPTT